MTTMTDEEVWKVVAERDGWVELETDVVELHFPGGYLPTKQKRWFHGAGIAALPFEKPSNYLHSRDAIAPVLRRLTGEEMAELVEIVGREHLQGPIWTWRRGVRIALMLTPEQLARCIAEAIVACRKEGV